MTKAPLEFEYCSLPDCERLLYSKGLCHSHYCRKNYADRAGIPFDTRPIGGRGGTRAVDYFARTPEGLKVCNRCKAALALVEFPKNRRFPDGYTPFCRTCRQVRRSAQYTISQEALKKLWEAQEGKCPICATDILLVGKTIEGKYVRAAAIDHDHNCCSGQGSCGKCVRGLLCATCNHGLGMFKDSPDSLLAAANYLNSFVL